MIEQRPHRCIIPSTEPAREFKLAVVVVAVRPSAVPRFPFDATLTYFSIFSLSTILHTFLLFFWYLPDVSKMKCHHKKSFFFLILGRFTFIIMTENNNNNKYNNNNNNNDKFYPKIFPHTLYIFFLSYLYLFIHICTHNYMYYYSFTFPSLYIIMMYQFMPFWYQAALVFAPFFCYY